MNKPQRSAANGPWIDRTDMGAFLAFCSDNGYQTREHPGMYSTGYQVRFQGHWMALLWNKGFQRYTVDRRLSLVVQSFAASKKKE